MSAREARGAGPWRRTAAVPLPGGRLLALHRRTVLATAVLLAVTLAVAVLTVTTGTYDLDLAGVLRTLTGGGSGTDRFIVLHQRVPRVVAAAAVGTALGLSGAVFQSMSRNPLGSPDIVGFTTGASTGGLVVILLTASPTTFSIAGATVVGGLATAAAVVLLTVRRGVGGERLILAGIAVGAMLSSLNDYLIARATIESAEAAKAWQFGSLNAITWSPVVPLVAAVAVLAPATLTIGRQLHTLELGDETAVALGTPVRRVRVTALTLGVALAAVAVAAAGPIGFLALAAPQLARRVAGRPGIALGPSAAMGAFLLVAADLGAQRLLSPFQIPVGLVSAALGGVYLLWLLGFSRE
ncbi:iron chelate uptake ABC transporter family permease subunit [Cellulomonas fimi]|uniref:FecCD family ABC transporter permease n=1 Tax=Cellulomonas sp. RIT-PI-Y TaxID=3035297 RepID=UPI0021D7D5FC